MSIEINGTIDVLPLGKDDIVVVRLHDIVPNSKMVDVQEHLKPYFPDNKVLVLNGCDLDVISPEPTK